MIKILTLTILLFFVCGCEDKEMQRVSHVMRLKPGDDLKKSLDHYCQQQQIKASCIVTCVGSLTKANIRFANQKEGTLMEGHFEIVSLVGIVAISGSHVHISISDGDGKMIGGHLLDGSIVYTTAEIVLDEFKDKEFLRTPCPLSGYNELEIRKK